MLRKVTNGFNHTINSLGLVASFLIVFTMLLVTADVVMRYFLNNPIQWATEITEYGLLYTTFLGAAWVLSREGHVRMDVVLIRLGPKTQACLNTITSIIGALIWLTVTVFSVKATWNFYQLGYYFFTPLETPKFIVLGIIPLGSVLLFIQFIRRAYGYSPGWTGQEPELQINI
ncbi:TRAP transporter small permease subunit [Chloroflexota bacterium]